VSLDEEEVREVSLNDTVYYRRELPKLLNILGNGMNTKSHKLKKKIRDSFIPEGKVF